MSVLDDLFKVAITYTRPGGQQKHNTTFSIHAPNQSNARAQVMSNIKAGKYSGVPSGSHIISSTTSKIPK